LCGECLLPIRDGKVRTLRIFETDPPNEEERTFHEWCYKTAKRKALKSHAPPNGRVLLDPRDSQTPISPMRRIAGFGLLAAGIVLTVWLVKTAPPAHPLLPAQDWAKMPREAPSSAPWGASGGGTPVAIPTAWRVLLSLAGIAVALWVLYLKIAGVNRPASPSDAGADAREEER
jgi:hypothetical protein